jgi:hypothetical protein
MFNIERMLIKAHKEDLLDSIEIEEDKSLTYNFKAMLNAEY